MNGFGPGILVLAAAIASLIALLVWWSFYYRTPSRYRENIRRSGKVDEMRDEQWGAAEDASAHDYPAGW